MYMQGGGLWCGTRCVEDTYARSRRVKVQVCRPQQVNVRLFTNECFSLSSKQVNRQFMRGKTINERGRSSTFMNEWAGGSGVEKGIGRRSTNCTIFLARPWSRRGGECKGSGNGPCAARNVRESSHLFAPDLRFVWGRQGQRGSRSGNSMCIFGRRSLVVSTLLYLHVLAPWIAIFYSLQSSHRCCQRRGRKKKNRASCRHSRRVTLIRPQAGDRQLQRATFRLLDASATTRFPWISAQRGTSELTLFHAVHAMITVPCRLL